MSQTVPDDSHPYIKQKCIQLDTVFVCVQSLLTLKKGRKEAGQEGVCGELPVR